uniref:50S ribosomal protein L9, chloroplastic n=1 Tax=Polysiphonia sertularioides TaxID=945028 RepID=A0A1Z1M8Z7_9FLOR|nr:ribosomal protein L9 [Polysiphonia sertularioides]ARW62568.1 ribosomal protein L9 [Polysiphonia sertularioides]
MKKKIKLIIKNSDRQINNRESLISVSRGYAINYLIPQKKAKLPTKKQIQHLKMFERIRKTKEAKNERQVSLLQQKIEFIHKISLYRKIGKNNLIFGSISEKDIMEWINRNTSIEKEKIQIQITNAKKTGIINGTIETRNDIVHKIQINIIPINI